MKVGKKSRPEFFKLATRIALIKVIPHGVMNVLGEMGGYVGDLWHNHGFGHEAKELNCLMTNIIAEVRSC